MTSLGQAVSRLEQDLLVGRARELETFGAWLWGDARVPEILNVSGPGGVGKSTLLRAFKRIAIEGGRAVVLASGGSFPVTSRGLLGALGGSATSDLDGVLAHLNAARALILLDTFDELADLTGYLQDEVLPGLATSVRLVIASRCPLGLAWSRSELWRKLIRPLRLERFSPSESREYLNHRGINQAGLVDQVIAAAGNNPLALSLAADLALRFDVGDFASAPEWHLVVSSLVEQLLAEVRDPRLRELVEASVAVRQFDETTLAAISGRDDIRAAFGQLCQLSIVSPAEHGLMLHDDVRRRLTEDLAWRHPDRYNTLRGRALAYYRERARSAPLSEREWLVADRFFLWGNPLIQELFFTADEPGQVLVQPGQAADHAEIRRLFGMDMAVHPPDIEVGCLSEPQADAVFLEAILAYPSTRLRVARDRDGRTVGFSTVLPVCQETVPLLDLHPAFAPLIHARWSPADLAALPASPDGTTILYVLHVVYAGETPGAIRAALLRDLSCVFASGGIHLCSTFVPVIKRMLETCGYERVPAATNEAWGSNYPVDGYVLDLSRIGFEPWMEAVMSGRRPPRPIDRATLEEQVHGALRHWTDDEWLACSRLGELPGVPSADSGTGRPAAIRQAIVEALAAARSQAVAGQGLA